MTKLHEILDMDVLSYCSDKESASILANLMASAKHPESAAKKQCRKKKKKKRKGMKKCIEKALVERFWTDGKEKSCRYCRSSSASVEMTAYMAATLVMQGRMQEALKSIKWLGKQRNSQGGFVSTQDTVVALQAISLYSLRVSRNPMNLNIMVKSKPKLLKKFLLNEDNKLLLQVLDKQNIAKGTTYPRVEFCLPKSQVLTQILIKFQNSKSQPNISISTKL